MFKKVCLSLCLVLSICLFFVQGASNDWLKDAFSYSHRPGNSEPYAVDAEAKDLFDTQLDLIGSIKKGLEGNSSVNELIDEYKKGESLGPEIDAVLEKFINGDINRLQAITAIEGAPVDFNDSVFVRATRFMMKVAVVLAIPMLIFAAIKIISAVGDEGKMKEGLKQVAYVAGGVVLALMSVMIIYLITSLTRSSVGFI